MVRHMLPLNRVATLDLLTCLYLALYRTIWTQSPAGSQRFSEHSLLQEQALASTSGRVGAGAGANLPLSGVLPFLGAQGQVDVEKSEATLMLHLNTFHRPLSLLLTVPRHRGAPWPYLLINTTWDLQD